MKRIIVVIIILAAAGGGFYWFKNHGGDMRRGQFIHQPGERSRIQHPPVTPDLGTEL